MFQLESIHSMGQTRTSFQTTGDMMKKLALLITLVATPALACPDMDNAKDNAPKTAEKDKTEKKETPKQDTTAKAKEQPKKEAPKTETKTAKPEQKAPAKPTDKVSSK